MIKGYDCTIEYHLGKVIFLVDALSQKSKFSNTSLNVVSTSLLTKSKSSNAILSVEALGGLFAHFQVRRTLIDDIIWENQEIQYS